MLRAILSFLSACVLAGCASSIPLKVHEINTLASAQRDTGGFKGLEYLADKIPGQLKYRVNIIYLHGIGYTEDRTKKQLANDFLGGIAKAYKLDAADGLVTTLCGDAPITEADKAKTHIYIKADRPRIFETAVPGSKLQLDDLACMDKQTLNIDENLEFVVYRVFWDNIFWNGLQFAHLGQDDHQGASTEFAGLRKKYNRDLKDDFVNYGFSDAVMYLGEAGTDIRLAIKAAMCSAALDAAGTDFDQQTARPDKRVTVTEACSQAGQTAINVSQFAYVTESLGSKIIFDVMQEAMRDGQQTVHDQMIRGSETYMLANQIALLSLGNLSRSPQKSVDKFGPKERPRIVAMSELNDLLSYEIIPFYEQIFKRSLRKDGYIGAIPDRYRESFIQDVGFDIIDMRLEFADKIIPMVGSFVDPKDAHTGHAGEEKLMKYILCGADNGDLKAAGCLAGERNKKKKSKS